MRDRNDIVREGQLAIRRELDRRGIHLKAVSLDSGIPYATVVSYFPGEKNAAPATMSAAALYGLIGAIPPDLLSLLLPPGHMIVKVAEGVDYDDISAACRDFVDTKEKAHHPESEAGRDIGPGEEATLGAKVIRLRA